MNDEIMDAEIVRSSDAPDDNGIVVTRNKDSETVVEAVEHGMSKLYLSGPMTGSANYNHETFHRVAKEFRDVDFMVCNPAEFFEGDTTRERKEYMRESFKYILEADTVVLLPGWEESRGARLEAAVATELGLIMMEYVEADDRTNHDDFAGELSASPQYTASFTPIDEDGNEIIASQSTFTPVEETP
jgi:hypothetical protein